MNEKNLAYLKDNVKYMGFGDLLQPALEKNIQQRFPEFILKLDTEFNKKPFSAVLHFKKGENTDLYFFNRWDATLKNGVGKVEQGFYINKGQGVTLKEGFNLLEGRAVHKELMNAEGQKYNAWLQLNFKERDVNGQYKMNQYHQNYGFNLEKVLSQFAIKELQNEQQKDILLRSLHKGNIAGVTMEKEGSIAKMYVETNPQFKSLQVYDGNMQRMKMEQVEYFKVAKAPEVKHENTIEKKSEVKQEEKKQEVRQTKEKKNKVEQKKEVELLPKKRRSTKKGLSLG